jgi:YfiH family protein
MMDRSTIEPIDDFRAFGIDAFTTTRETGSFGTATDEPVAQVMGRWENLQRLVAQSAPRFATARQVHGKRVLTHTTGWSGWLRADAADGHIGPTRGLGLAVTVADCVPVFIAHPSGVVAVLHAGWRGIAGGILAVALRDLRAAGLAAADLVMHLGPAICGDCYEVSPDVYNTLTGRTVERPTTLDLRGLLAEQARRDGVRRIEVSPFCTLCHQGRFFSHRGGDVGRQLGVIISPS